MHRRRVLGQQRRAGLQGRYRSDRTDRADRSGDAYVCNGAPGDAGVIGAAAPLQLDGGVLSLDVGTGPAQLVRGDDPRLSGDFVSSLRQGLVIDAYQSLAAFGTSSVPWVKLSNGRPVMSFSGSQALVLLAQNQPMLSQNGAGLSVAIWFNAPASGPIYSHYECGALFILMQLQNHGITTVYDLNSSRPYVSSPAGIALDDGAWHLAVQVVDPASGQHRLYIDGRPPAAGGPGLITAPTGPAAWNTGKVFALGYQQGVCNPDTYLTGQLDGFRVWQRALDDGDVAALYAATRPLYP